MRRFRPKSRNSEPAGFTLFELMIAMGVLLLVAGIVWPAAMSFYQRSNLTEAGQAVREVLGRSRLSAIDHGMPYLFLYEPAGRYFLMVPAGGVEEAGNELAQSTPTVRTSSGELPEGYQFVSGDESNTGTVKLTEAQIGSLSGTGNLAATKWSAPAFFYADGSSSGIAFEIENDQRQFLSVSVRSLTGGITISQIQNRGEDRR